MARVQCICQICSCGHHRCPHHPRPPIPTPRGVMCKLNNSEYKSEYLPRSYQQPRSMIRPQQRTPENTDPFDTYTMYQNAYVNHMQPKPPIEKGPTHTVPHDGPMSGSTVYTKDYSVKVGEKADSFRPARAYKKPSQTFPRISNYTASYLPFPQNLTRSLPVLQLGQMIQLKGPFEKDTVTSLDYKPPGQTERAKPIVREGQPLGTGDMETTTVYQKEFTLKDLEERPKAINPYNQFNTPKVAFEGVSTMKEEYRRFPFQAKVKSCKPLNVYKPTEALDEARTTAASDYRLWPREPMIKPAWIPDKKFVPPTVGFGDQTEYTGAYVGHETNQITKHRPLPKHLYIGQDMTRPTPKSIYHSSFRDHPNFDRVKPINREGEYKPPTPGGPFSGPKLLQSCYRGSYKGETGVRAGQIIQPGNEVIMYDCKDPTISTYRADYKDLPPYRPPITPLLYNVPPEGIKTWRGEFKPAGNKEDHLLFNVTEPVPPITA